MVPFFFPKGKGNNYSFPHWYNHHLGIPDPPSRDEEEAPAANVVTLPQVIRCTYIGMVLVKARVTRVRPLSKVTSYTWEYRNDTGNGKQIQPAGTPSSEDDDAPDGWHEWRRAQEAIYTCSAR